MPLPFHTELASRLQTYHMILMSGSETHVTYGIAASVQAVRFTDGAVVQMEHWVLPGQQPTLS